MLITSKASKMTTVKEFIEIFQPVEMEDTLNKLNDELAEYPVAFRRKVNSRILELKFGKENTCSRVHAIYCEADVYVVNKRGVIYIAGAFVDSRTLLEFGRKQLPAIEITRVWKN